MITDEDIFKIENQIKNLKLKIKGLKIIQKHQEQDQYLKIEDKYRFSFNIHDGYFTFYVLENKNNLISESCIIDVGFLDEDIFYKIEVCKNINELNQKKEKAKWETEAF